MFRSGLVTEGDTFLSSYVDVGATSKETQLKNLLAHAPGKKALGDDDEVPGILYAVRYYDISGKLIDSRVSDQPLDAVEFGSLDHNKGGKKPVIEIRTRVSAAGPGLGNGFPSQQPHYDSEDDEPDGMDGYYRYDPPARLAYPNGPGGDGLKAFKAEKPEMVIHSPYLCAALSAVVGYYPNFNYVGEGTTIPAPYDVVVHHWDALKLYKDSQPACHDSEYAATTAKHIDLLLSFLDQTFSEKLDAESSRWNNPLGATATFGMFWMLLKPGEVAYREKDGSMTPYVISSVVRNESDRGRRECYNVTYWDVVFQTNSLVRRMHSLSISSWNGERTISTLPLIPARFVPGGEKEMAEKQARLGKEYWGLAKQPSYREYNGTVSNRDGKREGNMSGRVIVDCEGFVRYRDGPQGNYYAPPGRGPRRERPAMDVLPQSQPRCACKICSKARLPLVPGPFAGFDNLRPKKDDLPGNADLYFQVLSDSIQAFVLGERRWAHVKVEFLSEVRADQEAFKYLVLDDEIKLTVKALIGKFANSDGKVSPWPSDFVKNKGEGRIFLLHGSPGVGKTCTAECVAELTHRPLLCLTSGDIGTHADSAERSLSYYLTLGERFGALVLLDEADVYLEARRTRDLQRNGLVSMFLRALEYYKGVLFLTTNRVEAFDSAFTSRIHIALHYRKLNDEDRGRIWVHNFERLERESAGKCYVPPSTRRYALESPEIRQLRFNGREIRNALQTAVAMAETEALESAVDTVTVREKHLRAIVRMSSGFKAFLKTKGWYEDEGDDEEEKGGEAVNPVKLLGEHTAGDKADEEDDEEDTDGDSDEPEYAGEQK